MKFLNGESAAPPAGFLDGVAVAAFDLVFICCCAESLDFLTGDFLRAAVVTAPALGRVAGDLALEPAAESFDFTGVAFSDLPVALFLVADADFGLPVAPGPAAAVVDLAAAFRVVVLAVAFLAGLLAVSALPAVGFPPAADFFAAGFFAGALFAAAFFAGAFFAVACLAGAVAFDFAAELLAAVLRVAVFFLGAVAVSLEAPLPVALAPRLVEGFSVVVAAMICLWFLTCGRARELLTPGNSKGA